MGTKVYDNFADLITFTRASGGTYLDSDGLLKTASTNVPRIEYDASGAVKGLLIEEARTNLVANEYNRTGSPAWGLGASVTQAQNQISITGDSNTAWSYNGTGDPSDYLSRGLVAIVADVWHTESKIVKKISGSDWLMLDMRFPTNASGRVLCWFNIGAGVKGTSSVSAGTAIAQLLGHDIEDLGNGYYRVWMTVKSTTGTQSGSSIVSVAADGSTTPAAGVLINEFWQLEAGTFPTSSIRTTGATATRAADLASIPTSAFGYNQRAGTVVVEATTSNSANISASRRPYTLSGVNSQVGATFIFDNSVFDISDSAASSGKHGTAIKSGSMAIVNNAGTPRTSSASLDGDYSAATIVIGGFLSGTNALNGHIRSIAYYPRRLTNTQLQDLTS